MPNLKGFFLLLLAAIFYSINDILIRIVSAELSTYQQLFIRCIAGFLFALVITLYAKRRFQLGKTSKIYLLLYAIELPLAVIFFTIGITSTKVSSVVFAYYSGFFLLSFLLSVFLFKENVSFIKFFSLLLVIVGLIFLTFPFSINEINIGFWAGLGSGLLGSIGGSLSKHFSNKTDKTLLMTTQMIGAIFIGGMCLLFTHQPFLPKISIFTLILCAVSGVLLVSTVYLTVKGFYKFDLHLGSIVISSELFFAPFFAYILFRERMTTLELFGGLLIALAIVLPHIKYQK